MGRSMNNYDPCSKTYPFYKDELGNKVWTKSGTNNYQLSDEGAVMNKDIHKVVAGIWIWLA